MCGICGVIDWSDSPDAAGMVRRMNPTMVNRGPDDDGYLDVQDVGSLSIGMRRLSIIDLEGGHQPIFNEDGRVGAVLNGEIYNFQELRTQLEELGHTFRTRSDTEVTVHAYEEWGTECVERFEGMFALAVWDGRTQEADGSRQKAGGGKLFLARDRLGIKPLYYYAGSSDVEFPTADLQTQPEIRNSQFAIRNFFLFASEVRTLLASGVVPRKLSQSAVESYLLFGSVGEPMTLIDGVLSLPPGHRMTIELNSSRGSSTPEQYWNIATSTSVRTQTSSNGHSQPADFQAAATQVRGLLQASVRKHLIADVPVGVFLSSGIDSTALAALASREVSGVHTFTVAFEEKEFSEALIARRTAERFGTTHQEVLLSGNEMLAQLGQAVNSLDQPSMDGINTYFVSEAARAAGLKVALSGLGGDEVFGGYSTFRRTPAFDLIGSVGGHVPQKLRAAVASAAAVGVGSRVRGDVLRKVTALWNDKESLPHPFFFGRTLFTPPQVAGLMKADANGDGALWRDWLADSVVQTLNLDAFTTVTCLEVRSYLVNTLLRDTDSMSMAHSLEVRVPFLDHPLVEFVTQLPQELKQRKGVAKALLVAALDDLLPSEVTQQSKRGFTLPWANWLRGPLKKDVEQGLMDLAPALSEAIDGAVVSAVWNDYLAGKTSWSRPWSLYVLNEWVKRHIG